MAKEQLCFDGGTIKVFSSRERVCFQNHDLSLTLSNVMEMVARELPDVSGADLLFEYISLTPYDLILRKRYPIEFQKVKDGFQLKVYSYVTLHQVIKEAEALPDWHKYGHDKTKVFWRKGELCLYIGN